MIRTRRRGREFALQMLYQIDVTGVAFDDVTARFWNEHEVDPAVRVFAESLVAGARGDLDAIDDRLSTAAENWRLDRMAAVDRNILRLAVHELQRGETPPAVVIDEAIEIAKRFGGEDSGQFVNGVLDSVRKRLEETRDGEIGVGAGSGTDAE